MLQIKLIFGQIKVIQALESILKFLLFFRKKGRKNSCVGHPIFLDVTFLQFLTFSFYLQAGYRPQMGGMNPQQQQQQNMMRMQNPQLMAQLQRGPGNMNQGGPVGPGGPQQQQMGGYGGPQPQQQNRY